ncbi:MULTISPECIES: GNAT family protein [Vagococcus]|uniref:Acetyltransferase n=1 Tax=Vagococcus fluvialis bH819 TaxID=1255619 RepID=A0A1X6WL43_9ENTE|nr:MULTISPECIES: GNAT family protein [Vagococcus]SLM85044.1 Acetyltransferase [Vagococcus fluvialis bH819]HCM88540.1 N-acetyltransferase [Vagococcus sp.]
MSKLDITLREATPQDAQELLRVMNILDKETPFLLVNPYSLKLKEEAMADQIDFIYEEDNQLILLAFNHDELIGVATVTGENDQPVRHIGEIGISILKEFWGYGLGSIMIEEIIDWATDGNVIKRLEIKVQERNKRAFSLYQKLNFEIEGTIKYGFLSEDHEYLDIILMSYILE